MALLSLFLLRIFYQHNAPWLVACLLTIHAWIHIPDIIKKSDPLWAYWSWVMEWFCGRRSHAVSSHKWPYSSPNQQILEISTLHSIRHMYKLENPLPVYTAMYNLKTFPTYHNAKQYPEITLLHPRSLLNFHSSSLLSL
ncbi:hypothetical protein M407DRAFT_79835 [Tulasnella calospora MUT 4182]|uniref:Uncharacterized protein n=1 Tax=Tulasnella calospora MUT 4182 TaxID=1051891 RepID=A0A0C3LKP5_9AGAM|nr:hypothetical protein M407DRAFT_79835 [Tulasnella calospora MUT 4182]